MDSSWRLSYINGMDNTTEQKQTIKKNVTAFPLTTPKLTIFIDIMTFDLMSDMKSFLQDKSAICLLAILLEDPTIHQESFYLNH